MYSLDNENFPLSGSILPPYTRQERKTMGNSGVQTQPARLKSKRYYIHYAMASLASICIHIKRIKFSSRLPRAVAKRSGQPELIWRISKKPGFKSKLQTSNVSAGQVVGHSEVHRADRGSNPGSFERGRERHRARARGLLPRVRANHSDQVHGRDWQR